MHLDFSVIIPFYNAKVEEFQRALTSVCVQASEPVQLEIICIDDGSDPGFAQAAGATIRNAQCTTRLITHPGNLGLAAARNTGIEHAQGNYIVFLDADDWLHDGALSQIKTLMDATKPELTYTLTTLERGATSKGEVARGDEAISKAFGDRGNSRATPENLPELALAMSSWALVYSRQFLLEHGLRFDGVLRRWEDRPFILAAQLAASNVQFCDTKLHAYNVGHAGGGSITRRRFDRLDIACMSRHIRQVESRIATISTPGITGFAAQHYWQSVSRFYTVIGTALWPIWFSNRHARRIAIGTADRLDTRGRAVRAAVGDIPPPHQALALSRIPKFASRYLVWSLAIGRNPMKLLNLWLLSGLVSAARNFRRRR